MSRQNTFRAFAYVTRLNNQEPEILIGSYNSKTFVVETASSNKDEIPIILTAQIQKQSGINITELKAHGLMTSFVDIEKKGIKNLIYHFQLIQEMPSHWSVAISEKEKIIWKFLPISSSEAVLPNPADQALNLVKHFFTTDICSADFTAKVSKKVIAFITRGSGLTTEFLVLEKIDQPWEKLQVVGGTVESKEKTLESLRREVEEESGIKSNELIIKENISTYFRYNPFTKMINHRKVFHCVLTAMRPTSWEHTVGGSDKDKGMRFKFTFLPLFTDEWTLHAGLDQGIDLLRRKIKVQL